MTEKKNHGLFTYFGGPNLSSQTVDTAHDSDI